MINSVNSNITTGVNNFKKNLTEKSMSAETASTASKAENAATANNKDSFVKSSDKDLSQVTYSKPKKDYSAEVNSLLEQHAKQVEDFKTQLLSMVSKQGQSSNLSMFGMNLSASASDIEAAKQSVSENGEWGVKAVATRIMDMAYALSGGDESKLETLKKAVNDGFKAAGFDPGNRNGSNMPAITGQTYDEVMKRFDDWKEGNDGWHSGNTVEEE